MVLTVSFNVIMTFTVLQVGYDSLNFFMIYVIWLD